jgi:hypothetical protein
MLGRTGTKCFHKNKKYSPTLAQTLSKFFFFKDLWKSLENQIIKVGLCVKRTKLTNRVLGLFLCCFWHMCVLKNILMKIGNQECT